MSTNKMLLLGYSYYDDMKLLYLMQILVGFSAFV